MNELKQIEELCDHLIACADLWEGSGVSRVRTIKRTAGEIRKLVNDALWEQAGFVSLAESQRARATVEAE